jgi:hypothetical protein
MPDENLESTLQNNGLTQAEGRIERSARSGFQNEHDLSEKRLRPLPNHAPLAERTL